ncbi:Zinc finger GRF-type protein [Rutstroemia sp. NJR-2017a BBW]|nr:Zinc finger GRF-type protein [Rutstroemia sp. NJR-2017a BBW]
MFTTPRKKGGYASSSNTPTRNGPVNGLFSDGMWICNCSPRLPAVHFQVKKQGPNNGKWFYTCQEPKESACGFFIWEDKAHTREMAAVIKKTSTLVDPENDKRTLEGHATASNKWMDDLRKKSDDEFGAWPLREEEEDKIIERVEQVIPGSFPQTPRKPVHSNPLTPGSKRKREDKNDEANALPTPATVQRDEDVFGTPATRRLRGGMWDGNERSAKRFKDALATPSETPSALEKKTGRELHLNYDITEDVLELLKDQHIDSEVETKLREILNRHAMKISGIVKGRDITRVALKTKDSTISELRQKISALESERDLSSAIIKQLREQK